MVITAAYSNCVFINCPFDEHFLNQFRAIVFAVIDCGFLARCTMEVEDAGEVRIQKIERIISESKYGIHDLSRTELDTHNHLPRFNMPLELGIFLGAKRFGDHEQKSKRCMIMDTEQYRYQQFISDIAGQDIKAHAGDVRTTISIVCSFLRNQSRRTTVPGGALVMAHYLKFADRLPEILESHRILADEMSFNDFSQISAVWIKDEAQ